MGGSKIEKSIRIVVIGHASTRWRGAKTNVEADRLNQALSNQRANNVRANVEQTLKRLLPGVKILADASYPPNVHPPGVPLGSYGVGSREPVLNPPKSPTRDSNENERLNRSVYVQIQWASTEEGVAGRSGGVVFDVRSKDWKGQVKQLWGAGDALAFLNIELALTNLQTGKSGTYSGKLVGPSLPMIIKPTLIGDVGDPFTFKTKDAMIFPDFNHKTVHVENVGITIGLFVGARVSNSYISFVDLGPGASRIKFDSSSSFLANGVNLKGFLVRGSLKLEKTDLDGTGASNTVPYKIEKGWGDGMIVTFPTGRSRVVDIPTDERTRLDRFVQRWVGKL